MSCSFGIPAFLGNFIARMYEGLHRHVSYKGWFSPHAATAPNGMAQGCSLSLLAINLYMRVWVLMIERLPSITAHAFVDDSYLWTSLAHATELSSALQITNLWDVLSGQLQMRINARHGAQIVLLGRRLNHSFRR